MATPVESVLTELALNGDDGFVVTTTLVIAEEESTLKVTEAMVPRGVEIVEVYVPSALAVVCTPGAGRGGALWVVEVLEEGSEPGALDGGAVGSSCLVAGLVVAAWVVE